MNPNDCLEDNVTFNDMTNYIKHSSCTDLTIYSTCSDTGQAFRFTQAGTMSTSYGGTNAGDDRRWRANDADTYPYIEGLGGSHLKFYTGNDIYFYDNAVEEFRFYDNSVDIKGDRAIYVNDDECYVGHGAGDNITAGSGICNTLIGHDAGNALTTEDNCVFVGFEAGKSNTITGVTGIGYLALLANTGAYNTAIGFRALTANVVGTSNTAIGDDTLLANIGGTCNIAVGASAAAGIISGSNNTVIGVSALRDLTTGNNNTAVGRNAGRNTAIDISGCAYLGFSAGKNNATSNRLYINNSDSAYPLIYGEFDNDTVKFGDSSALFFFKFSHDANDAIVETEAANRSIYLKPQGTGLVKFGTYAGKGAEAFAGFITMEDSGGTARKIMVCA